MEDDFPAICQSVNGDRTPRLEEAWSRFASELGLALAEGRELRAFARTARAWGERGRRPELWAAAAETWDAWAHAEGADELGAALGLLHHDHKKAALV